MESRCWLVQYVKLGCASQGSIVLGTLTIAALKRKKCHEKDFGNHVFNLLGGGWVVVV